MAVTYSLLPSIKYTQTQRFSIGLAIASPKQQKCEIKGKHPALFLPNSGKKINRKESNPRNVQTSSTFHAAEGAMIEAPSLRKRDLGYDAYQVSVSSD